MLLMPRKTVTENDKIQFTYKDKIDEELKKIYN